MDEQEKEIEEIKQNTKDKLSQAKAGMRQYYERLLKNNPDVMSVEQVAQFTGYNKNSVSRWCGKKELKCFYIKQRYQIPKEYLLDFLVSRYFIGIAVKSVKHQRFNEQIRKLRTGSDGNI